MSGVIGLIDCRPVIKKGLRGGLAVDTTGVELWGVEGVAVALKS